MPSSNRWPDLIGHMILLQQQIDELDPGGPYTYALPRVAASQERLQHVEAVRGEPLDPGYREFLGHADGWPEFSLSLQLMGTKELLGEVRPTADDYLDVTLGDIAATWRREELFPVAVASEDKDVVAVGRPGTRVAGAVVWFAGEEVAWYACFQDWFEDELEHHQRALEKLRSGRSLG